MHLLGVSSGYHLGWGFFPPSASVIQPVPFFTLWRSSKYHSEPAWLLGSSCIAQHEEYLLSNRFLMTFIRDCFQHFKLCFTKGSGVRFCRVRSIRKMVLWLMSSFIWHSRHHGTIICWCTLCPLWRFWSKWSQYWHCRDAKEPAFSHRKPNCLQFRASKSTMFSHPDSAYISSLHTVDQCPTIQQSCSSNTTEVKDCKDDGGV